MKYVILAAGIGKRLKELTKNNHKSLVEHKGRPVIFPFLDNLKSDDNIIMVVGYLKDLVMSEIKKNYPNLNITFIENNEYETSGTAHSLWLAKEHLNEGFVYANGDLIPDKRMFDDLKKGDNIMFIDQNKFFYNNMIKFSAEAANALFDLKHHKDGKVYDAIFKILGRFDFKTIDITDYNWKEIDRKEDLE